MDKDLTLSNVNVSDGQWHAVSVQRVGQWVVLQMDAGERKYFNESRSTLNSLRINLTLFCHFVAK